MGTPKNMIAIFHQFPAKVVDSSKEKGAIFRVFDWNEHFITRIVTFISQHEW